MEKGLDYNLKKATLTYTAIFAIAAIGVYFLFIYNDKTLLRFAFENKDSFSQRYMFIFEFKRFLSTLFSGGTVNTWDWSIGLGADGFAFNVSNFFNPFSYMTLLAPEKYMDLVFTATVILRVYLSGFCFILFERKIGLSYYQSMAGALLYAFSPWVIYASLLQATFLWATIMLPLVLMGVEKFFRKESPALFVLSVGYTVIVSFFFAYIIGIITLLYFLVRYFTMYREGGVKEFFLTAVRFIGQGILGLMISAVCLVVTIVKYSASTAATSKDISLLLTTKQLLRMPMKLVDWISVFGSNSIIGLSSISLILIPVIIYCAWKKKTNAVMTLLLFAISIFPVVNSAFNFFSYPSGRWMFAITFFIVLATAECLDGDLLKKRGIQISMVVFACAYGAYLMWLKKILTPEEKLMVAINFAVALMLLVLIFFAAVKGREKFWQGAVLVISLVGIVIVNNSAVNIRYDGYEGYLDRGQAGKLMANAQQRIGTKIEDSDFYRIDQVDEVTGNRSPHGKINEAMYFGNRSNYVFISSVNYNWLKYNKLLGNNMGYYKRVSPNSNDNRFGLDLLSGTKYFIGSDGGEHKDSSAYAGYGFEKYKNIEGTELLKHKYSIGLGTAYYNYMSESQWLKLSYPDREIAMLKAAILPDGEKPEGLKELKAGDVKTGVKELDYTVEKVAGSDTALRISAENDEDHAVILSVENVDSENPGNIMAKADNGEILKANAKSKDSEQGLPDIKDFTMYMGTGEKAAKSIVLDIYAGKEHLKCDYDKIRLYQVPLSEYDKGAKVLEENRLVTEKFSNDIYKGTINSKDSSIVYLSLIDDGGWDVYVDGKKSEKIKDVNIAFTGVKVTGGKHEIELKYRSRGSVAGAAISALGLIILLAILIKRKVR